MTTPLRRADILIECFRNMTWERDDKTFGEPRDNEEILIDLIADLYHWAWEMDEDFENCVAVAIKNGRTEKQINAFSKGDLL
jgi:hypothetical protein